MGIMVATGHPSRRRSKKVSGKWLVTRARGTAREPNSMGFTEFIDELRYDEPAVFIYAPMV
jgi:hypothetical protein